MAKTTDIASAPIADSVSETTTRLNEGRGVPNKNAIQETLLDTASAGYRPSLPIRGFTHDWWPTYQFWFDIEDMLDHSSVFTPLMFVQAPIMVCEHEVESNDPRAKAFVESQIEHFWTNCLRHVLDSESPYGWMGGEVVYKHVDRYLSLDKIRAFAPRDVVPLQIDSEIVGIELRGGTAGPLRLWTGADKVPSKGFWHAHRPRFGYFFGRSILRPAWRDWKRLAGREGFEEIADVGAHRYALNFTMIRYPNEKVTDENGREVRSRDIAREMGESLRAGATIELPSTRYNANNGAGGEYKWDLDFKAPATELNQLGEREDLFRKRIAASIGCPPELMEAADTGSGFSGRMIPMMAFLLSRQSHANELTQTLVDTILKPLVFWNFGKKVWIRVKVKPLLETFHKLFAPQGKIMGPGGQVAGSQPPLPAARDMGAAANPNSKFNINAPTPDQVMAAITVAQQEAVAHGNPHANDEEIETLKGLLKGGGRPEGDDGYVGTVSRAKHLKAIGVGKNAGRTAYDCEAQRLLKAQGDSQGQGNKVKAALGGDYDYSSTQVNLTGDAALWVLNAIKAIDPEDLATKGTETMPHVTVLYGLHDDDPERAAGIIAQSPPLSFRIGRPKVFQKGECDVLVYEILPSSDSALWDLNTKLRTLPNSNKYPDYQPHATIAYLKPGKGQKYAELIGYPTTPIEVVARDVIFSSSSGDYYLCPVGGHIPQDGVRFALGWTAEQTRTGHTKAVGNAEHAGRVLYGAEAERALNPSSGGVDPSGGEPDGDTPTFNGDKPNAYNVLAKLHNNQPLTPEDAVAFADHVSVMSAHELQAVNNILIAKLGGPESHSRIVGELRQEAKKRLPTPKAKVTPPSLPTRQGQQSQPAPAGDAFADYQPTGEGLNTIPKPKAAPATPPVPNRAPPPPKNTGRGQESRPAADIAEERYSKLRVGDYRGKGHSHEADIANATANAAEGIRSRRTADWHHRHAEGFNPKGPIAQRASINAGASKELIRKLDEFVKKHGMGYKTPATADDWQTRHDPVTIYSNKDFTPEQRAELAKITAPHTRGDDGLIGERIGKGVSIDKEPTDADVRGVMDRIAKTNPDAVRSLHGWMQGGRPSAGMFHVMKQMADEYDPPAQTAKEPVKPDGKTPPAPTPAPAKGQAANVPITHPSVETFDAFKQADEVAHGHLSRVHKAYSGKDAAAIRKAAEGYDKAIAGRNDPRERAMSNLLWEMHGHSQRVSQPRASLPKVEAKTPPPNVAKAPEPIAPKKADPRANEALEDAFNEPAAPTSSPTKPKQDARANAALDEAFADGSVISAKPTPAYEVPKPQPGPAIDKREAQPTPAPKSPAPLVTPPKDIHPDLAGMKSFQEADVKHQADLRDTHAEHANKNAKQLDRLAQQQEAKAQAIPKGAYEHGYETQKAKMLREMHGQAVTKEAAAQQQKEAAKQAERDAKVKAKEATKPTAPATQTPSESAPPKAMGPKKIHPELAAMESFQNADEEHKESLRDVHAGNIGRSSGALFRSLQRQKLAADRAEENNDPNAGELRHHANLLEEMHKQALDREEKKNRGNKSARRQEYMESTAPKRDPKNKLRHIVGQYGGIDPKHLKDFNVQEDLKEGGLQSLIRHGGRSMDDLAQELESDGYFRTPPNRNADDYLMELLQNDADHDQAGGRSQEHQYAYEHHQSMMRDYEAHQATLADELEKARDEETESDIAEALRSGKADGRDAAQAALPPDARAAEVPDEYDGFPDDGISGADDDAGDGGTGDGDGDGFGPTGTGLDDDFPFGANTPDDDATVTDDDTESMFTPDVPGGDRAPVSNPVAEQQEPTTPPETTSAPTPETRQEESSGPPTETDVDEANQVAGRMTQNAERADAERTVAQQRDAATSKQIDDTDAALNQQAMGVAPWDRDAVRARGNDITGKAGEPQANIHDDMLPSDAEAQRKAATIAAQRRANNPVKGPTYPEMTPEEADEEYQKHLAKQQGGGTMSPKEDVQKASPTTGDEVLSNPTLGAGKMQWLADNETLLDRHSQATGTTVKSFDGWKREGRSVRKGEKRKAFRVRAGTYTDTDPRTGNPISVPKYKTAYGFTEDQLTDTKKPTEASVKAVDPVRLPVNDPSLDAPLKGKANDATLEPEIFHRAEGEEGTEAVVTKHPNGWMVTHRDADAGKPISHKLFLANRLMDAITHANTIRGKEGQANANPQEAAPTPTAEPQAATGEANATPTIATAKTDEQGSRAMLTGEALPLLKSLQGAMSRTEDEEGGVLSGDGKRLLTDIHREWSKDHPGVPLADFKEALHQRHQQGDLTLSRLDLVLGIDHDRVANSEIKGLGSATYHTLHGRELRDDIQRHEAKESAKPKANPVQSSPTSVPKKAPAKKSAAKPKPVAVPDHAKEHAADWQQAAANLRAQGKRAAGRALADEFKRIREGKGPAKESVKEMAKKDGFGDLGASHHFHGMSDKESAAHMQTLQGRALRDLKPDVEGIAAAGTPLHLDQHEFDASVQQALAETSKHGLTFDELYAIVGKKHDISKHDFMRAIHQGGNGNHYKLGGWAKSIHDLPDPSLMYHIANKAMYLVYRNENAPRLKSKKS